MYLTSTSNFSGKKKVIFLSQFLSDILREAVFSRRSSLLEFSRSQESPVPCEVSPFSGRISFQCRIRIRLDSDREQSSKRVCAPIHSGDVGEDANVKNSSIICNAWYPAEK